MDAVNIRELYDCDPRPTFVVDSHARPASICHINSALESLHQVAASLHSPGIFRDWWHPESRAAVRAQDTFRHGRIRWTKFLVRRRWLVVTIWEQQPSQELFSDNKEPDETLRSSASLLPQEETIFTVKIQSPELREHIKYVQHIDWGATSLGPLESWSYEMNFIVTMLMLETRPTALFLGPDHIILYNLAYAGISGSRHPNILGQSIIDAWPEAADPVTATLERSRKTSFTDAPEEEYHAMVERYGIVEEVFFRWSLVPIVGPVDGLYSIVTEVTKQRLLERRVNALLRVSQLTSAARDTETFWDAISEAIKPYEYDFPTALLYSTSELDTASSVSSMRSSSRTCTLEWSIGYRNDHPAIPKILDLENDEGLARALYNSARKGTITLHRIEDNTLPIQLYEDVEKRAFGDPGKAFIVIPVRISEDTISGYLVVGINTRRPYDEEYQDWIEVFSKLLGALAASVALHEEEVRGRKRAVEQAAKDREALNAEVAVLTQEANDVAKQLQNFHDVANRVGLGYFEYDTHGRLVHANNAFYLQSGYPMDPDAPEFTFVDRIYPPDIERTMQQWHTLVAGNPVKFEMRWKKLPDKTYGSEEDTRDYLWILSACVPIKSEDGDVIGISGCNTDVSAQKEATRAALLRVEAERRLASFTELAPIGFYFLTTSLEIQYCNDKWFEITGHPRVPNDQISWPSVIHPEDIDGIYKDVEIILKDKRPHAFSFRLKTPWIGPDGVSSPTWILATATAEVDEEGNAKSIIGTLTDVSNLKWAETMQKVRVEEALESKRQQENFIDMTSHEMRNPLSAMIQCADSISSSLNEMVDVMREDAAQWPKLYDLINTSLDAIDTIQACATHQKRIVDDILTLSKLDSKLLIISPIIMQPSLLLQDTFKMFKDEAHKAGVHLEICTESSFEEKQIDWVILDPSRVLQVLINLITNAIKFTHDQPIRKVEISMGATTTPQKRPGIEYVPPETPRQEFLEQSEWGNGKIFYLHFTVRDTGCGLTPEHKAKLFLRFSQATPKTHVQYGGSGLGLFISRELTEMQGGSIGVQSSQDEGSIFSFFVKSRQAQPPQSPAHQIELKSRSMAHVPIRAKAEIFKNSSLPSAYPGDPKSAAALASPSRRPFHILIVEDNLINQRVLSAQLRKRGCTIQVANHGAEALTELAKTAFWKHPTVSPAPDLSVVLLDVEMPVMDGLSCARKIRELQKTGQIVGHVPIIAVSANARREQVEQARKAGMDDAISKPFRIPELMAKVEKLIEGGQDDSSYRHSDDK